MNNLLLIGIVLAIISIGGLCFELGKCYGMSECRKDSEVRGGKWIFDGVKTYCSQCGKSTMGLQGNFCSNCGADMRESEVEE